MNSPVPVKQEMTLDMLLNALLIEWFEHFRGYTLSGPGHRSDSISTQDYRTPTHHDWKNGAADERADDLQVRAVDAAINRVPNTPERWRTALEFNARNLHQRYSVWNSPLLPATKAEREVLLLEARNKFAMELRKNGVIG